MGKEEIIKIDGYEGKAYLINACGCCFGAGPEFENLFYRVFTSIKGYLQGIPKNKLWELQITSTAKTRIGSKDKIEQLEELVSMHNQLLEADSKEPKE